MPFCHVHIIAISVNVFAVSLLSFANVFVCTRAHSKMTQKTKFRMKNTPLFLAGLYAHLSASWSTHTLNFHIMFDICLEIFQHFIQTVSDIVLQCKLKMM